MLNFRSIFEFFFKSFDISGDTKIIEKMKEEGIRFLMVVKRHRFYPVINSWRVILVVIIAFLNLYLLTFYDKVKHNINSYIIAGLLLINLLYWLIIVINYIKKYYTLRGSRPYIEDIYSCIKKAKESDKIFTYFFNQTVFLLLFLIFIAIFTLITSVLALIDGRGLSSGVNVINTLLVLVQIGLFYSYLNIMINAEMDFKIAAPGKILLFNQKGLFGDTQSMNSNKIKTMNTRYTGFLSSIFNYGSIIVLSEGDVQNNGEMIIDYVGDPVKSVKEMEKVLKNDLAAIEKEVNVLLKKLKLEVGITDISTPENKLLLKKYVEENEDKMKEIFLKADDETKKELKELYILINS